MTDSFSMDMSIFKSDARKLQLLSDEALPAAVEYTLNELAVQTWKRSKRDLKDNFTLRNTWTARNMAFGKVTPGRRDISQMRSMAGSRLEYMREQQEGVKNDARGKHGVPIPTTSATGEGQGRTRRKRVLRKHYMSNLRMAQGAFMKAKRSARSSKQVLPALVSIARKMRKRFIYWESPGGKRGIFQIDGDRLNMIYDLSEKRITSIPRPWLEEATDKVTPMFRKIYGKALFFQLRKLGAR